MVVLRRGMGCLWRNPVSVRRATGDDDVEMRSCFAFV